MAIALTLMVPFVGFLARDLWEATNAAQRETTKMRDLRRQMERDRRERE